MHQTEPQTPALEHKLSYDDSVAVSESLTNVCQRCMFFLKSCVAAFISALKCPKDRRCQIEHIVWCFSNAVDLLLSLWMHDVQQRGSLPVVYMKTCCTPWHTSTLCLLENHRFLRWRYGPQEVQTSHHCFHCRHLSLTCHYSQQHVATGHNWSSCSSGSHLWTARESLDIINGIALVSFLFALFRNKLPRTHTQGLMIHHAGYIFKWHHAFATIGGRSVLSTGKPAKNHPKLTKVIDDCFFVSRRDTRRVWVLAISLTTLIYMSQATESQQDEDATNRMVRS